ncbi:hypothetical protein GOPIP_087_00340 [Gordonia polyisoprenivorans NBRC 16320 = JCM 10675]|uniref:Uncharacterized protein n=1 Tax=Gordonia polyisoprenivorans TaxID=84595 RepID=A0A846WEK9_9ACTN|nr:hypothetical protein [Gordonia polyisoprenivorans]NKY00024.1 hypothetical protein [Gordonia polyisoprenivorans]OZC33709.1 hypothetical protein CJJ17_21080 [Gordonia polyisoprenivorans]GAB25644.1 hypothetical protein GOPIP_087_00340 [Gordonia polyisoprenivorans NBRC 16320 = JCM 10675]
MSEFIKKIKDEAKAVEAAIDNELTVLEGVPGYDPLAKDEDESDDASATASDDTEGGGSPVDEPK